MIKYVQNKNIDFRLFEEKLALTSQKNQYTNSGPAKKLLEKKLEDLLGISSDKSVLCVANGTLALHSIYIFLKKGYGNLKIVSPSFTFLISFRFSWFYAKCSHFLQFVHKIFNFFQI